MTTTISTPQHTPLAIDESGAFAYACVERAVFDCGIDRAYEALFDLGQWERLLPHILRIDVTYDDGQYQEFIMTVKSESDGSPLTVRSVRNCAPRAIEFFQPEPPAFLEHHGGIWRFDERPDGRTDVEITHVWNLHPELAQQIFPADADGSTAEKVERTLAGHSRITLGTWQSILAGEV